MTIRVITLKSMQRSHLLTVSLSRSLRSTELLHQSPSAVTEGGPQFKEIAALVGLAPYNKESGKQRGLQRIRGGRSQIRTVMFMAMMSTIQCNPKFKAFYEKLKAAGKRPKVALVACMRKK